MFNVFRSRWSLNAPVFLDAKKFPHDATLEAIFTNHSLFLTFILYQNIYCGHFGRLERELPWKHFVPHNLIVKEFISLPSVFTKAQFALFCLFTRHNFILTLVAFFFQWICFKITLICHGKILQSGVSRPPHSTRFSFHIRT